MSKEQYLKGKVAIVTGASRTYGIGGVTALALAEHGADVLVHYGTDAAGADEVVEAVRSFGVRASTISADAADPEFGQVVVSATLRAFETDTIDIIVNCAGVSSKHEEGAAGVPVEAWDLIFHVNVRGPFLLVQAALPHMKTGGRIVNVSSVLGKLGSHMLHVYGASKGALNSLTVSLADELSSRGITVNAVAPGPINLSPPSGGESASISEDDNRRGITEQLLKTDPTAARLYSNQHMKGRKGTPREVAQAILFLASPASAFITGQHVYVDGGINVP